MVLTTTNKYIKYVSPIYHGTNHDYAIFKKKFPSQRQHWLAAFQFHVDLGYLGIKKDYPALKVNIPHKKPKKKELTKEQKIENKGYSSIRIKVEHAV